MSRIANYQVSGFVIDREEFKTNNGTLYGVHIDNKYVVFSYGQHFPLFIYVDGRWFENSDKYSVTTSKHHSYAHPRAETTELNTAGMRLLAGG